MHAIRYEQQGPMGVVRLGLAVWASEMKLMAERLLLRLELSQLGKRLTREQAKLGRLAADPGANPAEIDLTRKQAVFLEEEMGRLAKDFEARREMLVAERIRKLGLSED